MRLAAPALVVSLALAIPAPVFATAPAPPAEAAPPAKAGPSSDASDALTEAKGLYKSGQAKFETFQYAEAIADWTKAYELVPRSEDNREIRNNLAYNIAIAQEKAYEVDHDVIHLRQAVGLLTKYVAEYKSLYKATPEARDEIANIEARIAELNAKIEAAGQDTGGAAPPPTATGAPASFNDAVERKRKVKEILRNDPEISPQYKSGRAMLISGAVVLGAGALMGLTALAYISPNNTREDEIAIISVGVSGAILAVAGAVLLGIGIPRRKQAVRAARERVSRSPTRKDRVQIGWSGGPGAWVRF